MTPLWRKSVAFFALAFLAGCGPLPPAGAVFVVREPPRPRAEVLIGAPGPGFTWIAGYWQWGREEYRWVPGRWERPPARFRHWEPGRWRHHRNGWYWVEGRWR